MRAPEEAPRIYDDYDVSAGPETVRPKADAYWARVMGHKEPAPDPPVKPARTRRAR